MSPRRAWILFALGTLAGLAGLVFLTRLVLARSQATAVAAVEAQVAEDMRAALSRMDLRFAPLLTRAAARVEGALVESGAEVTAFRVELPDGNAVPDLAAPAPSPSICERANAALSAQPEPELALETIPPRGAGREQWVQRADERSTQEYLARQNTNFPNNANVRVPGLIEPDATIPLCASALQAQWEANGTVLAFGRRLERGPRSSYQVFRFAWPLLEELLLSVTRDLFPVARLEPVEPDAPPSGDRLATLPARLVVPRAALAASTDRTLVAALAGAWLLALVAAGGAALALRASLSDAQRQRRFTTAVTHELRTPLTTFRLYGEMLAKGMVPAERQGEYLHAIEQEAARLGGLVENVLAYARLEQNGARAVRERVRVDALLERHRASLDRRCAQAGTALEVDLGAAGAEWLETDVHGIGLVLANLVDNACKYGAPAGGHRTAQPLRLAGRIAGERVELALEDPGPGVLPDVARDIFRPFERGGRDESDAVPGVGLGLALARDVAHALGGDLVLDPRVGGGARFVLWLPRARSGRPG